MAFQDLPVLHDAQQSFAFAFICRDAWSLKSPLAKGFSRSGLRLHSHRLRLRYFRLSQKLGCFLRRCRVDIETGAPLKSCRLR